MAWVTVPPCGICLQHQRDSLQDLQLLSWFRRILLLISTQWFPWGVFPNAQTPAGNPWCVSFVPFWQDRPLPTAVTVVTRPKPCGKHSFNNYIRYKLLLVHILIHVVNKHRLVGAHFNFLGVEGLYLWKVWIPGADCISLSHAYFSFEQVGFFAENLEAVELF